MVAWCCDQTFLQEVGREQYGSGSKSRQAKPVITSLEPDWEPAHNPELANTYVKCLHIVYQIQGMMLFKRVETWCPFY